MLQIITDQEEFKELAFKMVRLAIESLPAGNTVPKPEIMTGEQVCEKLSITIQTLMRYRQKGKIPFIQIGSSIRYDFNKVIEALEVTSKKGARK